MKLSSRLLVLLVTQTCWIHHIGQLVSGDTCPAGWLNYSSNCYFFSTTNATQTGARTACQAMNVDPLNSDLVSISDQAENDFIEDQADPGTRYWIGLWKTTATSVPDSLFWLDGNPSTYRRWVGLTTTNRCVNMLNHEYFDDYPCTQSERYICKAGQLVSGATCPAGWLTYSSNCYFFSTATATQTGARTACQAMNVAPLKSDLVSISDQAENDFIKDQVVSSTRYWIGLWKTTATQSHVSLWLDGNPSTYRSWAGLSTTNECIYMRSSFYYDDYLCTQSVKFICKAGPLVSGDTCPAGWLTYSSNCYFFSYTIATQTGARTACQAMNVAPLNSSLVSISDQAENNFLQSQADSGTRYWIGLWKTTSTSSFGSVWLDKNPSTYRSWVGLRTANQCVNMYNDEYYDNYPCTQSERYICKAGPLVSGDTCPAGWLTYSSNCYFFSTTSATQPDALTACQAMNVAPLNSSLVSISDQAENYFVHRHIISGKSYWIGLRKTTATQSKDSKWVDGNVSTYRNWAGLSKPNQCVNMNKDEYYDNYPCTQSEKYICKATYSETTTTDATTTAAETTTTPAETTTTPAETTTTAAATTTTVAETTTTPEETTTTPAETTTTAAKTTTTAAETTTTPAETTTTPAETTTTAAETTTTAAETTTTPVETTTTPAETTTTAAETTTTAAETSQTSASTTTTALPSTTTVTETSSTVTFTTITTTTATTAAETTTTPVETTTTPAETTTTAAETTTTAAETTTTPALTTTTPAETTTTLAETTTTAAETTTTPAETTTTRPETTTTVAESTTSVPETTTTPADTTTTPAETTTTAAETTTTAAETTTTPKASTTTATPPSTTTETKTSTTSFTTTSTTATSTTNYPVTTTATPAVGSVTTSNKTKTPRDGRRSWSEWGPCSTTCGTGVRSRVRSPCIYSASLPACTDDYKTQETRLCSLPDCPLSHDQVKYGHLFNIYGVAMNQLMYSKFPTYWTFIGQLAVSFNTYCNEHPGVCCRDPTTEYRATGRGLSFMTDDDIVTLPGFPQERADRHVQTMLLFYYRTDCDLCRAVRAFSRRGRRRRQADSDGTKQLIASDIVHAALNRQALRNTEEALALSVERLHSRFVNVTITEENKQLTYSASSHQTTTDAAGRSTSRTSGVGGDEGGLAWWMILLIVLAIILFILLIIILVVILCVCADRRRRRRGVGDSSSFLTTESETRSKPPQRSTTSQRAAAAGPASVRRPEQSRAAGPGKKHKMLDVGSSAPRTMSPVNI